MSVTFRVEVTELILVLTELKDADFPAPSVRVCPLDKNYVLIYWDTSRKHKKEMNFVATKSALTSILEHFKELGYDDPRILLMPEGEFHDFELIYDYK